MCLAASTLNIFILLQKNKQTNPVWSVSSSDSCWVWMSLTPVTREKHHIGKRGINDLRWECLVNNSLIIYHSFYWFRSKSHTEHLNKALRGAEPWFWVQKCPNSRIWSPGGVLSTVLLPLHMRNWPEFSLNWPNLVLTIWEGRNPSKPPNQKKNKNQSQFFFLPKFSKCHQMQTRRCWQMRKGRFFTPAFLGTRAGCPQGSPVTLCTSTLKVFRLPKPCQLPLMKDKRLRKEEKKMEKRQVAEIQSNNRVLLFIQMHSPGVFV